MLIQGLAAYRAKETLKPLQYEARELKPHEVLIKISYCGICHSDIHLIDNDWKSSSYPFIPGHEIIGTVQEAGAAVHHLHKGQRVGVGWQAGACFHCEWCLRGKENSCPQNQATCVRHHGGFADHVVADSRFAFPVPEQIDSAKAAPLMCAGITVFSPLIDLNVRPAMKVGVAGIGGLGHLALQFVRHFGCEVTAFSRTPSKKREASDLGADRFVSLSNASDVKGAASSVDVLLSTVSGDLDWQMMLDFLRPDGKLVILGASSGKMDVSPSALIPDQRSIVGHNTGGRATMQEMLAFAARHKIEPMIETADLKDANSAIGRVRKNAVRYRMVLRMV